MEKIREKEYVFHNPYSSELLIDLLPRALEAADLGPNVIEVPIGGKSRTEGESASPSQSTGGSEQ